MCDIPLFDVYSDKCFKKFLCWENGVLHVELAKFYTHYTPEIAEFSKCIKFENGLRADIKRAIGYKKIRNC